VPGEEEIIGYMVGNKKRREPWVMPDHPGGRG
jgi:hypothetical protein